MVDEAKAREFLDRHGELIMDALAASKRHAAELQSVAEQNSWHAIRKTCQEQVDETIAAMRELELLRGER